MTSLPEGEITPPIRLHVILAEWRRSSDAMRAAEICLSAGLSADAVARAYYAVLHAAKAALLLKDVAPRSHRAVRSGFGRYLITTGELDRELAWILSKGQDERLRADYDVEFDIETENAHTRLEEARRFRDAIEEFLRAHGVDTLRP